MFFDMVLDNYLSCVNINAGMKANQASSENNPRFDLRIERLGPLPLINHFIDRIGLEQLLE